VNPLLVAIYIVFALAALLTLWRIVKGPSILLGADMAINHHTRTLPVLLCLAAIGVFGSVAIARFVARREDRR
jgi:multicomponent Na+:H+ antiporter subunit F